MPSRSEAMTARWANATPEERAGMVEQAHEARRGQTDTIETLIRRAETKELRGELTLRESGLSDRKSVV